MHKTPEYSHEPADQRAYTASFDRFYTKFAHAYDLAVKRLPLWKTWLRRTLPYIQGPCVLEISFGTGYLLTQVAGRYQTFGLDYNRTMVETARMNLNQAGLCAHLLQGDVAVMPYPPASFDTILSTMAFSGYPDGRQALAEISRVLKPEGVLIVVDVNYPTNGNWAGRLVTEFAKRGGDLVRDMGALFRQANLTYTDQEIGAFGSIHLYRAVKATGGP